MICRKGDEENTASALKTWVPVVCILKCTPFIEAQEWQHRYHLSFHSRNSVVGGNIKSSHSAWRQGFSTILYS